MDSAKRFKIKIVNLLVLTSWIATAFAPAFARAQESYSKVLTAVSFSCGAIITFEKSPNRQTFIRWNLKSESTCSQLSVDSVGIKSNLKEGSNNFVYIDHNSIGAVLPIQIDGEFQVMDLSSNIIQSEISSSKTQLEIRKDRQAADAKIAFDQQQARIREKQANRRAVANGALLFGAILGIGAAATGKTVIDSLK